MKKGLLLVVGCWLMVVGAKAQWVSIPDSNFGTWLNTNGYSACMQGNNSIGWQMDTSCPAVVNETSIDCSNLSKKISDITGIQYFDNLDSLDCSMNNLTSIPPLPSQLVFFLCYYNQITSLPVLPNNLRELGCSQNQLTGLPQIPGNLKWLLCTQNQLTSIPELPDSLYYLWISANPIVCMPRIKRIVDLDFRATNISCVPNYGNVTNSLPAIDSLPLCDSSNANSCSYCRAFFSIYPDSLNQGVYYGFNQSYVSNLTSYLWEFGDGDTSALPYPSHIYAQPGQYYVCLTVSGPDCTNTYCDSSFYVFKTEGGLMTELHIVNPATAVSEIRNPQSAFRISPNPATNTVTISIDEEMIGSMVTISDITERKIEPVQLTTQHSTLTTSTFASGVYFVTVSNKEGRIATKKLVIDK